MTETNVTIEDVKDHLSLIKTSDGDKYLGIINCEMSNDKHLIEFARPVDPMGFTRADIRNWMKNFNMGELATIKLHGTMGYKTTPLNLDEKQWLDEVWYNMKKAMKWVQPYMVNEMLDRLEGVKE